MFEMGVGGFKLFWNVVPECIFCTFTVGYNQKIIIIFFVKSSWYHRFFFATFSYSWICIVCWVNIRYLGGSSKTKKTYSSKVCYWTYTTVPFGLMEDDQICIYCFDFFVFFFIRKLESALFAWIERKTLFFYLVSICAFAAFVWLRWKCVFAPFVAV